ncbi:HNH endonuclease [Haladaptatus sp. NG-WS-4]
MSSSWKTLQEMIGYISAIIKSKDEYPDDWEYRKRQVYKRDGYQCQNCGRKNRIHGNRNRVWKSDTSGDLKLRVHHVVPTSKGGLHHMNNLQTLCVDCYNAIYHWRAFAPTKNPTAGLEREFKILLGGFGGIYVMALTYTNPMEMIAIMSVLTGFYLIIME